MKDPIIDKILTEWAYRVHDGMPDPKDNYHLVQLQESMKSLKVESEVIDMVMNHLYEVKKPKPHKDTPLVKKLGGSALSDQDISDIIVGKKYKYQPLSGRGNTYNQSKAKWSASDITKELKNNKKLYITTAKSVTKVRSEYGERMAEMNISTAKNPSPGYKGQVRTLYKLAKMSGFEIKDRLPAGLGYEQMQVENVVLKLNQMLGHTGKKSLPLYINGTPVGVNINSADQPGGTAKADFTFNDGKKPVFWVSYKQGDYMDASGNILKSSFQQYGSLKTFYNKEFTGALDDLDIESVTTDFTMATADAIKKDGEYFSNVTGVQYDKNNNVEIITNGKPKLAKIQSKEVWKNFTRFATILKKKVDKKTGQETQAVKQIDNLYILDKSGWSKRRRIADAKETGQRIAMLAIFGKNYEKGAPGKDNCNLLMQDSAKFTISLMVDDNGDAGGVNMEVSNKGHLMWNPKIYGGSSKFPKFAAPYEPYFVARYTGEMDIEWKLGGELYMIIGARLLIMPESMTKTGSEI